MNQTECNWFESGSELIYDLDMTFFLDTDPEITFAVNWNCKIKLE